MSYSRLVKVLIVFLLFVAAGVMLYLNYASISLYAYNLINKPVVIVDHNYPPQDGTGSGTEILTDNWDTYINYDYRYVFDYPNSSVIENIQLANYINDPEKFNSIHNDNICVKIWYGVAWAHIYVNPKDPNIEKFCGKYVYDSEEEFERKQFNINEKYYVGQVFKNVNTILKPEFNEEQLTVVTIPNGDFDLKVEYGITNEVSKRDGKTYEDYLEDEKIIIAIIESIKPI